MASSLASSPIRLIHDSRPSLHQPGLYIFNQSQVQGYVLVRPWGNWSTHQKAFIILVKALTFHKRWSWRLHKEEILAMSSRAFIYTATKGYLRVIYLTPQRVGDLQEGSLPKSYIAQEVGVHPSIYLRLRK